MEPKTEATLAGGCFWCLEAVFKRVQGIEMVVSGYIGGDTPDPTYEAVCSKNTGHAEAVNLTFSPDIITYREILEIFFSIHDPTTPNRQGFDTGTQYRSAIFYRDEAQKKTAEAVITEIEQAKIWDNPIVTQVVPFTRFYEAEAYHQDYFARNSEQGYCRATIAPKVAHFRQKWAHKMKE